LSSEKETKDTSKHEQTKSETNPWDNPSIPVRRVDGGLRSRREPGKFPGNPQRG